MYECVLNAATGFDGPVSVLAKSAGASLRDVHRDEIHNRSVFTLVNDAAALREDTRSLIAAGFATLDLRGHEGVHPRLGVIDVVPFVALDHDDERAIELRDETATWIAESFAVPVFLYGPLPDEGWRSLPEIRRDAFRTLAPDAGPSTPHPRYGASAVGARGVLIAWNLWVYGVDLEEAKSIASSLRSESVRALAFPIGEFVQISCNLIEPDRTLPSDLYDQVRHRVGGGVIDRAELVGLLPEAVLAREDPARWDELGLSPEKTIESRLR